MGDVKSELELPAPSATGDFQKTPFSHLLVYAAERRLTGSLEFVADDGRRVVLALVGGHVGRAKTSEVFAPLGRVLLELRLITEDILYASLDRMAKGGALQGEILLAMGAIRPEDLIVGLEAQLARKLIHLFSFPDTTTFAFYDHFDLLAGYGGQEALSVDIFPILWKGLCVAPPWDHVDAALARVTNAWVRAKPTADFGRFRFEEDIAAEATQIAAAPVRVSDFSNGGALAASAAQLLLYCLLITRQVELVDPALVEGLRVVPESGAIATGVPPELSPAPNAGAADAVPLVLAATAHGTPPAAFAVARPATRAADPGSEPGQRARGWDSAASAATVAHLRAEVVATAARIDKQTYFEMFDLPEDADPAAIEYAFVRLAKKWHPDRLPPALEDLREAVTRIFGRFTEAHAMLSDPAGRVRYLNLVKEGGATPEAQEYIGRVVGAAMAFQKAEVCLRRSDFGQAERLCREALSADDTQADYLAMLSWLEALRPENQAPQATYERIAMLDRAILLNPRCERAHYYRGVLHKRVGSLPRAMEDFHKVIELNPKNVDAVREIRFQTQRRASTSSVGGASEPAKEGPGSAGGLLSKLFRKG